MAEHFELRFEGPADDSAPTLRRIKGVFVADLDFPASDVQRFLENAPVTIRTATSESELQGNYNLLKKAGARVLILKSADAAESAQVTGAELELEPLALEFDSIIPNSSRELVSAHDDSMPSLELSYDSLELAQPEMLLADDGANDAGDLSAGEESYFDISLPEKDSEVTQEQAPESADLSLSGGLSLEIEADPVIAEDKSKLPAQKENLSLESALQDSALELEVTTPATSSLFTHSEEIPAKAEALAEDIAVERTAQIPVAVSSSAKETFSAPREEEEEAQIELTLEQLKLLQKPRSRRLKISLLPLLAALLLLLLFQINKSILSSEPHENPFVALLDQIPQTNPEEEKAESERQLREKEKELNETSWFTSEQNFSNRSVKATVWVEKNVPIHGSIEVTTPEPAPLSKEEIVNGKMPPAWLRRLEIKDLIFKAEGSKFVASGPALAYFSLGEKNVRVPGNARLEASISDDQTRIFIEAGASSKAISELQSTDTPVISFELSSAEGGQSRTFDFHEKIEVLKK